MAKLLMISGDRALVSGQRGAFYNTLEEFHRYWERIDIICPRTVIRTNPEVKPQVYFGNVFLHPSPWPLWLQPWWILKRGQDLFREHKFDLITVHEYPPFYNGLGARWLWSKIKVPYVVEIHHISGYPRAGSFKEWFYRLFTGWFIAWDVAPAQAVRVVNQTQVPDFLKKAGIDTTRLAYIPSLYIDLKVFKPQGIDKKYDLIFVGRLTENKGIHLLLEAVKLSIINYQLSIKCLIVGDGPLRSVVEKKIRQSGLQNQIVLRGWVKDNQAVADALNSARLLVVPSYSEGGPRVVAEALACGVPFLGTPVGIIPDLVRSGCGCLIPWRAATISQQAQEFLADQTGYENCRQAGLKAVVAFEKRQATKCYADWLKSHIT